MLELSDEIFRTRGRAAVPVSAEVVRELESSDMILLSSERGTVAPPLKRLSEKHHALARNLAAGMDEGEAGIVTGYSVSRVSILKADPAFQELVLFYRNGVNAQYRDLHERLSGLALDAADELSQRLEEEPDKVSIGQLLEITKMGADRTGHGPQSSSTNLNVNVDLASRLELARKRVAERKVSGQ